MTTYPYMPVPSNDFIALRARLDIEDSPIQKINTYWQKLMPANLCFRSLAFRVDINFPLSYRQLNK